MSEDVDIKMVPDDETLALSKNQQRQLRRATHQCVLGLIIQSDQFELTRPPTKRSEGKYQQFHISYPRDYDSISALRPHLQLDLTESCLLESPSELPLSSLYASTMTRGHEIQRMACVTVNSTASEKFVSLLRRTASHARDSSRTDDVTLIQHAYDLHLIYSSMKSPQNVRPMVQQVLKIDQLKFGNQHPELANDGNKELLYGLFILMEQPSHSERYKKFIGPLVYHPSPPRWSEVISSLQALAKHWL
jgi:hypothetical protein